MRELIDSIKTKHLLDGILIHPPASPSTISLFEEAIGFELPSDFKEFYSICNGFECNEDIFNMVTLPEIMEHDQDYGRNWFYFSEYMIYSDMWGLRLLENDKYEIFNGSYQMPLTSSLREFLERYLLGNIFDTGGIYEWQDELKKRN